MGSILRMRTFPGRFESLVSISDFVTQAAEDAGLDKRAIHAVQLAVDEACSNIIQHAYGGEGRGDIECTCRIDGAGLTVILRDEGCRFDPAAVPEPDASPTLDTCSGGGLGLFFMRQLMDEVHFEFDQGDGNVLTMSKYREGSFADA
ncbi:MAG TPA: ATP-binding protein [Chloroflexi bacterium]|nr:ATP-binding protein [Chloroflexota bacterium]